MKRIYRNEKNQAKHDKDRKVSLTLSITLETAKKARKLHGNLGKAVEFAVLNYAK